MTFRWSESSDACNYAHMCKQHTGSISKLYSPGQLILHWCVKENDQKFLGPKSEAAYFAPRCANIHDTVCTISATCVRPCCASHTQWDHCSASRPTADSGIPHRVTLLPTVPILELTDSPELCTYWSSGVLSRCTDVPNLPAEGPAAD